MKLYSNILKVLTFFICLILLVKCTKHQSDENQTEQIKNTYLNLNDTVKYVGMTQCRQCHQDIYNNFLQTGMGQSFDTASRSKSSAKFQKETVVYDKYSDLSYHPFWKGDDYFIKEFRLNGKDTVHNRTEKVDYIIGSGQHTNSHMFNSNGYIFQMPLTFYTQKGHWDLPPGYEGGNNTRFNRKIGLECMTCHNSYPSFQQGSENKYKSIPNGINCERCHGPGEVHVKERITGSKVDTSKYIDYSIVNPGKLPVDLQFDVCQRCHLQGNAVLQEGKSFFDFKPGMKLSEVMSVFVPKYKGMEDKFIMASHADRLKMSPCFIETEKQQSKKDNLRPYKNSLTCVTCHNPHVSVKVTGEDIFNAACRNCHNDKSEKLCTEDLKVRMKVEDNCFSCHMPRSGTLDIPHVTSTDHYIRKPVTKKQAEEIKEFIGLYAVNDKAPSRLIRAKAYINQYDKFTRDPVFLDSAQSLLSDKTSEDLVRNFEVLVHLYFIKGNSQKIKEYVERVGEKALLNRILVRKSLDNQNAWTSYRIGESFYNLSELDRSYTFFQNAIRLSPYNLEFQNKLGTVYTAKGNVSEATKVFERILKADPKFAPAYSNLGYMRLLNGNIKEAEELYNKALYLDPNYELALLNKAGLHIYKKETGKAKDLLKRILIRNPANQKAKEILEQL